MNIDKAFEKWLKKYVKENDNVDYDLIILEDMLAAWKQSRIDTLGEIKKKIKIRLKGVKSMIISEWIYEVIDTELKESE